MPERGVEDARSFGVGLEIGDAGEIVLVESFLPGFAAVGGFEDAAIGAGGGDAQERVAEDAHVDDVRILGIYDDRADVFRFFQADVGPGGAGIGGFVDAVAGGLLAGADVYDFWIRRSDGDCADGGDVLRVEDREPDLTCIGGFPDAAAGRGHVVGGWVAGDAGDAGDAAGAVRADEAPAHGGILVGID